LHLLIAWHGLFAGAWVMAYLTAEGSAVLHNFTGYVAVGLLAIRLAVAALANAKSIWALPWANTTLWQSFWRRLNSQGMAAFTTRTPFAPLSGLALLCAVLLAGVSGLLANTEAFGELHEGCADLSLIVVVGHLIIVASTPLLRLLARQGATSETGSMP
jgi:cytochrome b